MLLEFDVVSGCRCNCVELPGSPLRLQYTPDGGSLVLLTRVRAAALRGRGPCACVGMARVCLRAFVFVMVWLVRRGRASVQGPE